MILARIIQDIKKRPIAFIVMVFLVILGIELGFWQLRRADYKIRLSQEIEQKSTLPFLNANAQNWTIEQALYHRLQASGYWIVKEGIWLENRTHPIGKDPKTGITTGFNLLMPFRLEGQDNKILWVNRGWAPRSFNELNAVPHINTPSEKVMIEGVVFPDGGKTLQLSDQTDHRASDGLKIKENLKLDEEQQAHQWGQLPFVLRQTNSISSEALDQTLPTVNMGVNTHYGYAFQWFALAVMTFLFWAITAYRKISQSLR
jgi:cytochrome oxidase assembly protein ShyY1